MPSVPIWIGLSGWRLDARKEIDHGPFNFFIEPSRF